MRLPSLCFLCLVFLQATQLVAATSPNVLLICVDDLRCALGCYGDRTAVTPHIDSLAAKSRVFRRHYVFSGSDGPSRSTFLSGYQTTSWDYLQALRNATQPKEIADPAEPLSLPHCFRQQGYTTVCIGKVSNIPGGVIDAQWSAHDLPFSWDRCYAPLGNWKAPWSAFFSYANGEAYNAVVPGVQNESPRPPYESADVNDDGYADGLNAAAAIDELRKLSASERPFFLAVGFYKPHLPFNAPKKYWDLYQPDQFDPAPWPKPPEGSVEQLTLHKSHEPTSEYLWPDGIGNVNDEQARTLQHGYYAAVSYVDAQIGKVVDEYERLGLQENTLLVLWSDNGWHLGDHGIWGKETNFEWSLHTPLIIRTPALAQPGEPALGIVESIDVYATLTELCDVKPPAGLPGVSLRPLLADPKAVGKKSALGMLTRGDAFLGATLRTDRYRLVEWMQQSDGKLVLYELYDHSTDPMETRNVAGEQNEVLRTLDRALAQRLNEYQREKQRLDSSLQRVMTSADKSNGFHMLWFPWIAVAGVAVVLNLSLFAACRRN